MSPEIYQASGQELPRKPIEISMDFDIDHYEYDCFMACTPSGCAGHVMDDGASGFSFGDVCFEALEDEDPRRTFQVCLLIEEALALLKKSKEGDE